MRWPAPLFFGILLTGMTLFCAPPLYAEIAVNASLDRSSVYENEPVLLTIAVENGDGGESVQIPSSDAYVVQSYGTSNQTSIINGQMSRSVQYNYQLTPKKTGTLLIPEISVSADGQVFKTEPITLQVLTDQDAQNAPSQNGAGVSSQELFVELQMDKTTLCVDEPTLLHFRLFRREDLNLQAIQYDSPALKDFLSEPHGKQRNGTLTRQGMNYEVAELNTLLYPTKAGTFTVGPATISGQVLKRDSSNRRSRRGRSSPFDGFFGGSIFDDPFNSNVVQIPVNRTSNTLQVTVNPLPTAGKPAHFSGTVGHYRMSVDNTDLKNLKKGDAITLNITIEGEGHVASITEPQLLDLHDFKTFESEVQVTPMIQGNQIGGKKVFKKIIVPEKAGHLKLPTLSFDFFDPQTQGYRSETALGLDIQVQDVQSDPNAGKVFSAPSDNPSASFSTKKENIQWLGQDILFSRPDSSFLKPASLSFSWVPLALFCGGGAAFYGILFFSAQSLRRRRNDPARQRERSAHKKFRADIAKMSGKEPEVENFSLLQAALSDYVGNKLNLPGGILTSQEMERKLSAQGVPEILCRELKTLSETLDQWRYGLASTDSKAWKQLLESARQTLEKIENSWGKIKK